MTQIVFNKTDQTDNGVADLSGLFHDRLQYTDTDMFAEALPFRPRYLMFRDIKSLEEIDIGVLARTRGDERRHIEISVTNCKQDWVYEYGVSAVIKLRSHNTKT